MTAGNFQYLSDAVKQRQGSTRTLSTLTLPRCRPRVKDCGRPRAAPLLTVWWLPRDCSCGRSLRARGTSRTAIQAQHGRHALSAFTLPRRGSRVHWRATLRRRQGALRVVRMRSADRNRARARQRQRHGQHHEPESDALVAGHFSPVRWTDHVQRRCIDRCRARLNDVKRHIPEPETMCDRGGAPTC